jgi:hypothetical protein
MKSRSSSGSIRLLEKTLRKGRMALCNLLLSRIHHLLLIKEDVSRAVLRLTSFFPSLSARTFQTSHAAFLNLLLHATQGPDLTVSFFLFLRSLLFQKERENAKEESKPRKVEGPSTHYQWMIKTKVASIH